MPVYAAEIVTGLPPASAIDVKAASNAVRLGFVRKVYTILAVQLLLTTIVAVPFQTANKHWLQANSWMLGMSSVFMIATVCSMTCCQDLSRKYPTNYFFLFTFTIASGVLVGFASAMYTWQSVILATAITMLIFLGLTVYAWKSETDFTGMGPYLYGALLTLIVFSFVLSLLGLFGVKLNLLMVVYDLIAVFIFVFYIIFDTQMMLGDWGGHKNQFSVDDYVFASMNLYLDIINLFLHILSLFGERRE